MNFIKKAWLRSRWIECPPLKAEELLRQNTQAKQGLVMGMRLAVLEEQAAAVVVKNSLLAVFLPGAYQLEQDKMPPLQPDKKHDWLFPAELYFLNTALSAGHPWQPQKPLLTRDPERGLMQLLLAGEYDAQVDNASCFMRQMVLEQGYREWQALHDYLRLRLNELAVLLMARSQMPLARLDKLKEKTAQALQQEMNQELRESGLVLRAVRIHKLELHPQMQALLAQEQDYLAFNHALLRQIVG